MSNLFVIVGVIYQGFLDVVLDILSLFSILFGIYVINSKNPIVSVFFLIGLFLSVSLNLIFLGFNFIGLSYLLVYVGAVSILFLFILMLINVRISELLNDTNNGIPIAIFTSFAFGFPILQILIHLHSLKDKFLNLDLSYLLKSEINSEDFNNVNLEDTSNVSNLSNPVINYKNNFVLLENLPNNVEYDSKLIYTNDKGLNHNINTQNLDQLVSDDLYFAISNIWDNNMIEYSDISSIGNILYTTYGIWLIICSIILLLAMIGAISITKKEKD
jgi:NADH-ubiquinone oxidoreductase chain 6